MSTINVKAASGLRVPREDNGRKYITDNQEVPVEQMVYYLRRLADSDPVEVKVSPADGQFTPAADHDTPADRAPRVRPPRKEPGMAEIQLDQIPASTRKPGVHFEFNTKLARSSLPTNEQRVLIYAQRLSSDFTLALKLIDVFSNKDTAVYFGAGFMVHRMAINAIEANSNTQIAVITVDDVAASQDAEAEVEITATATGRGILTFQIGPESVSVELESGWYVGG